MEKGDNVRRGSNSGAAAVREDEVEEDPEEQLDPRIQVELEKLNSLTDVINKLELDLEVHKLSRLPYSQQGPRPPRM